MQSDHTDAKVLIGLVGFRCCGKSELRKIISGLGYPVFDTNSVKTGDSDADQIPMDEILHRYGNNTSYLLFLKSALEVFANSNRGILFIDSLKAAKDSHVLKSLFPNYHQEIWYLHASFKTRMSRYTNRDIRTNIRTGKLEDHDSALEKYGILELIKESNEILNMELELSEVRGLVTGLIAKVAKEHHVQD
jgi:dephospho-CoA kinase